MGSRNAGEKRMCMYANVGCLDVFLSPLKPPTKDSVSAEAINASLYYLHVATPEDDHLLQEVEEEQEEDTKLYKELFGEDPDVGPGQQELARLNNVRRKPVPGEDNGTEPQAGQDAKDSEEQQQQQEEREREVERGGEGNKPGENSSSLQPTPEQRPQAFPPTPPPFPESEPSVDEDQKENVPGQHVQFLERRPTRSRLPRRPLPSVPDVESVESSLDTLEGGHPAKKANRWSAMAGYVNNKGFENWREKFEGLSTRHSFDSHRPQLRPTVHECPSPSKSPRPSHSPSRQSHDSRSPDPNSGFHITLIRRDPTHGTQWNVATISTSRLDDGGIDIDISTPGYNRFIAKDEPLSLKNLGLNIQTEGAAAPSLAAIQALQESAGLLMNAQNAGNNNKPPSEPEPPGPRRFRRKLSVSRPFQDDARGGSTDQPGGVRASMDSGMMGPGGLSTSKTQALSKLKSGYYTFTSPWNGTCTFSTSVNGRSLKCKHMIPMPVPPGGAMESTSNPAVTVAEIRFNTPFQPGHLHHQPNPYHLSPFALSQTPAFPPEALDPSLSSSTTPNAGPNNPTATTAATTTTNPTSKRASFAAFVKQNALTNRPRSSSHTSNPSTTSAPPAPPPPPPTSTSTNPAVNTTINLGPGLGNLTRKPSTNSTSSNATTTAPVAPAPAPTKPQIHDDPDRLDFTLARERAGGGMRGKSAKLGKLVVEDEGIKMLDLVVAACMGVWWRGYYY